MLILACYLLLALDPVSAQCTCDLIQELSTSTPAMSSVTTDDATQRKCVALQAMTAPTPKLSLSPDL